MTYYFALVAKTDTTYLAEYARNDEKVRSFRVDQSEGDFAGLTVVIEKPSASLLDPSREQWCWLSRSVGSALEPLFFGRVVGLPADLQNEFLTVEFLAKPALYAQTKHTLAQTLKTAPFWDYAFIDPQRYQDDDAVMEARAAEWHIDRVTHEVTISSIMAGEDDDLLVFPYHLRSSSFNLTYTQTPLRKVQLQMRGMWTQVLDGSIDITEDIKTAFGGTITSYTGSGLYNDWPDDGDSIGGVYSFGPQTINVADGKSVRKKFLPVRVQYETAPENEGGGGIFGSSGGRGFLVPGYFQLSFRRWAFTATSIVNYSCQISRSEDITFNVSADVQDVVNDEDADSVLETITMSSGQLGVQVGEGSTAELEIPIGTLDAAIYFQTTRGAQSIDFGLAHARALLTRRARAAQLDFAVPFDLAVQASLRKSAIVEHPDLPGGTATGKIVGYQFGVDGDTGTESGTLTIACMVGTNATLSETTGDPVYGDDDYAGPDYQIFDGRTYITVEGEMTVEEITGGETAPLDFGVFSCTVQNGEAAQQAVLGGTTHLDIAAACDAVNAACTIVDLQMNEIITDPREAIFDPTAAYLTLPMGINLGGV